MSEMKIIGTVHTDFPDKFGLPRQSGLSPELTGEITFEPDYRVEEAFRGLEDFSHIWIIWEFSRNVGHTFSPTVRPPRLGGKKRIGVFATRSPYRPNPIGLSCVKLEKIEKTPHGTVLTVSGIDMADGTPVYDIKPYIPLTDCRPEATEGFTEKTKEHFLGVEMPEEIAVRLGEDKDGVTAFLSQDPRPAYDRADGRVYGVFYREYNIRFSVKNDIATVTEIGKR